MADDETLFLKETFYDPLLELIRRDQKFQDKSIILAFLRMTSNKIMDYLDKASIESGNIPPKMTKNLIDKGFIRGGEYFSQYIITAKGVWEIENNLGNISLDILVDEIDKYKFEIKKGGNLTNQDRVITLALIALRSFYEKTPLNRNNKYALGEMSEILKESKEFLIEMGAISNFEFTKPSNEDSVEAIFRRSNELKKRTRGIYCFGGKKHWIDIYNEETEEISFERLSYLLWKIFGGETTIEEQDIINTFCDNILNKYKNYVYNPEERQGFVFSNIRYKNIIRESLFKIIENKTNWEKMDSS
jgi:hypothetical protein